MTNDSFRSAWEEAVSMYRAEKAENVRLRAALTQFVAACDTAPPTSLMVEIGMACNAARAALSVTNGIREGK
jgi:hypothetical protein